MKRCIGVGVEGAAGLGLYCTVQYSTVPVQATGAGPPGTAGSEEVN
jgi:hypothetical protein